MSESTDKSKLAIVLLTYNRFEYAEATLRSVLENVWWSGEIRVHIADDGTDGDYRDRLRAIAGGYPNVGSTGVSNSERRGYGANWNLATQHVHPWADYVVPLEDDWVLDTTVLDVTSLVRVFEDTRIGCLRLGYLGFTQALYGEVIRVDGKPLLLLDPLSPEPHVFAGHPRIETVGWEKLAGPWPEGLEPGRTEFEVAHTVRRGIVWPLWMDPDRGPFIHIGSERAR